MAESAVSFLLDQLNVLLREERKLLGGIGNNAVYIRDELGHMRAFLRAVDAKEESDELLKEWVKRVREITYDTEDLLAMYMLLRFSYQRHYTSGLNGYIKKMYCSVKNLRSRHRIASEFQNIKLRLENVSKSRKRFKDVYNDMNERSSNKTYDTRGDALLLEEAEVVGIEKPKKQLLEWLMQTDDGLKVAESYLNELLNRSLIQLADAYADGRPKKFRIHDILRNYIISKSKEQNLLTVGCGEEMSCPDYKIRRMAISTSFNDTKESCNFQYLRSLFWLEFADSESGLMMFQKVLGGRCRLLKVLDIRGAPIDSIPTQVFKLYYLEYLSLRRTNIKHLPKSIGNLENLETLDLKKSKVTELPIEILKLHKLRHLLVYTYGDKGTFHSIAKTLKAPYAIGCNLTCLQKLCFIDADEAEDGIKIVREIGKLTQLRRLGITKLRIDDGKDLCFSLGKLTKLRTLYIYSMEEDEVLDLDHSLSSSSSPDLPFLRKVILKGRMEKFPQWVYSLDGLTELYLSWCGLVEDPLQHLGDLPNLLYLYMGELSYEGEELIFKERKFQKLELLILWKLRRLKSVRVEKGCMPYLVQMRVGDCEVMEELPEGIEHLTNLKDVWFIEMSEKFIRRLGMQEDEEEGVEWKLAHVSQVRGANRVNNKWTRWLE